MIKKIELFFQENRTFVFLIAFRWLSLLPALFTLNETNALLPPWLILAHAFFVNSFVSIFNRRLNKTVMNYPSFLGADILFSAFILAASGGAHSPYYLYTLNPLLAGAFFFQVRGSLLTSLLFTPLYIFANALQPQPLFEGVIFVTHLAGIWLIPILFAYTSTLLKSIEQGAEELSAAHRQLEIIHDLTILLQAAPDLLSVQERVLGAVTTDLGFSKAVVALVDPAHEEIGGWMVYPRLDSFPQVKTLPLKSENGGLIKALLNRNNFITNENQPLIQDMQLNDWLNQNQWYVMPLYLREHPVGIFMVEESGLAKEKESTLMPVANQAALALGTTILCIDRARRLAVETERNRIARDIHDTVAQSLFGIVYSLEACISMLPQQAEEVKQELLELRALASGAHDEVRRSVFDL